MSTTIFPALSGPVPERTSPATDAREQPSVSDAWRAAFQQAGGESFGGWFQAPADQPEAGASPGAAPLPAARAPTSLLSGPNGRFGTVQASDGGSRRVADGTRAATPAPASTSASVGGQPGAQAPSSATAASMASEPPAGAAPASASAPAGMAATDAEAAAAQLPAVLQSLFGSAVVLVPDGVQADAPEAISTPLPVSVGTTTSASELRDADAVEADDTAPAEAPASERGTGASTERDALRLHAEWTDTGVRIWLGADAQSLPDVAALTTQLQHWLATQGMSLLGLVCNGRDVLDPSTQRAGANAPRAGRRADAMPLPFDFSNLYSSETR